MNVVGRLFFQFFQVVLHPGDRLIDSRLEADLVRPPQRGPHLRAVEQVGGVLAGTIAQRMGVPFTLTFGAAVFWVFTLGMLVFRPAVARLE